MWYTKIHYSQVTYTMKVITHHRTQHKSDKKKERRTTHLYLPTKLYNIGSARLNVCLTKTLMMTSNWRE